jgi:methylmalonyl-CoA mutase N-terminal domain/subunit
VNGRRTEDGAAEEATLRADYAPDGHEHPGEFPYTRGISPEPGPWIMGQYAGFGTAAETNRRFHALLEAGGTGFSVALDLPTQMGLDSDDPAAAGEVGKVGVAIDSLADIETLMEGIPLEQISQVRTTANSIGYIWAAMFVALAEKRGVDPNAFGMFIQNDVLKEYIARGTQIFPPAASLRLSVDVLEYVARRMPRWVPLAVSGYHIREAGADAIQEIGFTFANAIAYLDAAVARGVSIDAVAPTLWTFLSANIDILAEVAKFRAARRTWATLIHQRYAARDPRSEQLRIFVFTAGSSLTAQQPLNNVVRATIEAMAAALAGVQTMHVCAYDEAIGVPTEAAATLALRTQQIVAHETGLTETVDPLGGSYAIEALTAEMARGIEATLGEIEARGGALACIESGWFADEIAASAYRQAQAVESGAKAVIGVNRFATLSDPISAFAMDPAGEQRQRDSLRAVRQRRSAEEVTRCLDLVESAARDGENIVPACVEAVKAYATVGEIVGRLRTVFGEWQASGAF